MMLTKKFLYNWEDYGLVQNIQFNQKFGLDELEYCFNSNEGFPKIGVSYNLRRNQLQSGGIFSKKYEDCLILTTTEIEECAGFVFTVQTMGNITKLSIYKLGTGTSQAQINKKNRRMSGGAVSKIAGLMTKVDSSAIEKENFYYYAVINVIKDLFLS
ncbi:MAG: hypothetical protein KH215_04970 [Coprobacillus sp.]|nr:hypothetical protein [Coprobacillus sp.]